MDTAELLVTLGGVALIALTLWFFFGKRSAVPPAGKGAVYACPMHPWITGDTAGSTCSVCGMALVKQEPS